MKEKKRKDLCGECVTVTKSYCKGKHYIQVKYVRVKINVIY